MKQNVKIVHLVTEQDLRILISHYGDLQNTSFLGFDRKTSVKISNLRSVGVVLEHYNCPRNRSNIVSDYTGVGMLAAFTNDCNYLPLHLDGVAGPVQDLPEDLIQSPGTGFD